VLIVTFPEKLKKLVSTMLTGTLVWPMLKFTIEGSDILKSPTETVAEAECNVPPGNPVPVIVTEYVPAEDELTKQSALMVRFV
jgi:hypothetical protein